MASLSSSFQFQKDGSDSSTGPDPGSGSDSEYEGKKFSDGEKVLVSHDKCFHKAEVIGLPRLQGMGRKYLVRYNGWNKSWDEWVHQSSVLRYTNVTYAEQLKLGKKKGFKSVMSSTVSKVKPGCPNREAFVVLLKTHLLDLKGLSLLLYVEKLLEEDKSVLDDFTNDILSAISSINGDLLGQSLSTKKEWETKQKRIHDFLDQQIQYSVQVAGRMDNTVLSQIEAERLATVWGVVKRYPFFTWGVDSLLDSVEDTLGCHLKKLLGSDDFESCMAALKVIKRLPTDIIEQYMSSIVKKIAGFTRNPETQVITAARLALVSCLEELGMKYLEVVNKSLGDIHEQECELRVQQEFEYEVLSLWDPDEPEEYDMHFDFVLLSCMSRHGKLNSCLKDLFAVVSEDVAAEQKNMRNICDSLKLIAENVRAKWQAKRLVYLVTAHVKELSSEKTRSVLEEIVETISAGFESNAYYALEDLIYYLIRDGDDEAESSVPGIVAGVGLDLLIKTLKKNKVEEFNQESLEALVGLSIRYLRNNQLVSSALKVLDLLLTSFPLISFTLEGDRLLEELLSIAKSERKIPLAGSLSFCQLLRWFIRNNKIKSKQLGEMMKFAAFEDIEKDQHCIALLLLEEGVEGSSVVTEIPEIENKVLDFAIKSNNEEIRVRCQTKLLEFLVQCPLSNKRLYAHMEYLLDKLGYDDQTETAVRALTILDATITGLVEAGKKKILIKHSKKLFANLLSRMPPPQVESSPSRIGAVIRCLIENVDGTCAGNLLVDCLACFYERPAAVAEVLVFFMKPLKSSIKRHVKTIVGKMKLSNTSFQNYCALGMVDKLLKAFPHCSPTTDDSFEDMWGKVFTLLLQPDARLRNLRCQLLEKYPEALKRKQGEISVKLEQLADQVQDMTQGNSGKRKLEEQVRDVKRIKRE